MTQPIIAILHAVRGDKRMSRWWEHRKTPMPQEGGSWWVADCRICRELEEPYQIAQMFIPWPVGPDNARYLNYTHTFYSKVSSHKEYHEKTHWHLIADAPTKTTGPLKPAASIAQGPSLRDGTSGERGQPGAGGAPEAVTEQQTPSGHAAQTQDTPPPAEPSQEEEE